MCRYILFAAGTVTDIATRSIAFHGTRNDLSSNQVCLCQCECTIEASVNYNYHPFLFK